MVVKLRAALKALVPPLFFADTCQKYFVPSASPCTVVTESVRVESFRKIPLPNVVSVAIVSR